MPLIGTIVCLRDAYYHRLRISDDAIELNTPRGLTGFRLQHPDFTAHWKHCPDRLVLKSRDGDTTIRFHDYKSGDKIEIISLLKETLPEAIQSEWEAFQSAQEQCRVRAEESAQRLRKYGPLMLPAFAGLFSAAAIQRREWHLLALVAVNIVVAIQVRRNKHSPSRPG